jgi:hypothetical protein
VPDIDLRHGLEQLTGKMLGCADATGCKCQLARL